MKRITGILILAVICWINLTADLTDSLVAYYPFNGNANDESGNGNDGTVYGATLIIDRFGDENSAYYFDGIDNYIICGNDQSINLSDSITVDAWIYPTGWGEYDSYGYGRIIDKDKFMIYLHDYNFSEYNDHSLSFALYIDGDQYVVNTPENSIILNEWQHIDVSYNGITVRIYIDGVSQSLTYSYGNIPQGSIDDNSEDILYIGESANLTRAFSGIIDDLLIYNRTLTEDEIQELYYGFHTNFNSPENAYLGEQIQFTDTSTGNPTTWQWDFENDGIYDAFIQNPTHIYNAIGTYDVKLKINNETYVDSLIKEDVITVEYVPPAAPQNVQVNIVHPDAVISWSAVDTTIFGDPITPDGYIVLYSENEEDYFFLELVADTTHTHHNVAEFRDQMFYQVVSYINYSREQIEYLEWLNNSQKKIKWIDVKRELERLKSKVTQNDRFFIFQSFN